MPTPATVTVIVVAEGPWEETRRCLLALAPATAGVPHRVVVVDDGTRDETAARLAALEGATVVRGDAPGGFARAANAAAGLADTAYLAFLHGDAEPAPEWLAPLVAIAEGDPGVAAVASRLVGADGQVEADGFFLAYAAPYPVTPVPHGAGARALPAEDALQVPACTAAALLVRADAFRRADGFDATYGPAAAELDLALRLGEAGGAVVVARASVAVHAGRCSPELSDADVARLTRRWLGKVPLQDAAGRRARPAPPARAGRTPISLVVPLRDALATIAPALEGLRRNLGPDDELVLADAGSEDGSREFAAAFARELGPRARLVEAGRAPGVGGALRAGLAAAAREVALVFPPVAEPPDGFLDALTALAPSGRAAVATPTPGGACVLAPVAVLRAVDGAAPEALLAPDLAALGAALAARGVPLGVVAQ